jgi:hypothetical protein
LFRVRYKVRSVAAVHREQQCIYVYPAHVEATAKAGYSMEPALKRVMITLDVAFRSGVALDVTARQSRRPSDG